MISYFYQLVGKLLNHSYFPQLPLTLQLNFSSRHPFPKLKKARQMEYGLESCWVPFVWCSDNSFHCVRMGHHRDPEIGIK